MREPVLVPIKPIVVLGRLKGTRFAPAPPPYGTWSTIRGAGTVADTVAATAPDTGTGAGTGTAAVTDTGAVTVTDAGTP